MWKCFGWLHGIIISDMICRHVGYWTDPNNITWDIGIRPNGDCVMIEIANPWLKGMGNLDYVRATL